MPLSGEMAIDGRKFARIMTLVEQVATRIRKLNIDVPEFLELESLIASCTQDAFTDLVPRLKRHVHDLAVQSGKKVHFVVEGSAVPLDRKVVRMLAEPLTHLLRNGMEHGLETGEERTRSGKRLNGRLTLLVLRQGGDVWISVEDDGRGMDRERLASLVGIGLHAVEAAGNGLSAVHKGMQQLGGRMEMLSRPGKGTRVTLKIPVSR